MSSLAGELKKIQRDKYRASLQTIVAAHKAGQTIPDQAYLRNHQESTTSVANFSFDFNCDSQSTETVSVQSVWDGEKRDQVGMASPSSAMNYENSPNTTVAENLPHQIGPESSSASTACDGTLNSNAQGSSAGIMTSCDNKPPSMLHDDHSGASCGKNNIGEEHPDSPSECDSKKAKNNGAKKKKKKKKAKQRNITTSEEKKEHTVSSTEEVDLEMEFLNSLLADTKVKSAGNRQSEAQSTPKKAQNERRPHNAKFNSAIAPTKTSGFASVGRITNPSSGGASAGSSSGPGLKFRSVKDSNLTPQARAKLKYGDGKNVVALSKALKVRDSNWLLGGLREPVERASVLSGQDYVGPDSCDPKTVGSVGIAKEQGPCGPSMTIAEAGLTNQDTQSNYVTHSSPFTFGFQLLG